MWECGLDAGVYGNQYVGSDPINKFSTVAGVFGESDLISIKGFVMPLFLFQCGLSTAGQTASEIVAASERSSISN